MNTSDHGLHTVDPNTHPGQDASAFRDIQAAAQQVAESRAALYDALRAARDAGQSWTVIATALGSSVETVKQQYREMSLEALVRDAEDTGLYDVPAPVWRAAVSSARLGYAEKRRAQT